MTAQGFEQIKELTKKINQNTAELEQLEILRTSFPQSKDVAESLFDKRNEQIKFFDIRRALYSKDKKLKEGKKDADAILSLLKKQDEMIKHGSIKLSPLEDHFFRRLVSGAIVIGGLYPELEKIEREKQLKREEELERKRQMSEVVKELEMEIKKREAEKKRRAKRVKR